MIPDSHVSERGPLLNTKSTHSPKILAAACTDHDSTASAGSIPYRSFVVRFTRHGCEDRSLFLCSLSLYSFLCCALLECATVRSLIVGRTVPESVSRDLLLDAASMSAGRGKEKPGY